MEDALVLLAKCPMLEAIRIHSEYTDYNDEYYGDWEWALSYQGKGFRDEMLDSVPEARRFERTFDGRMGIPFHSESYSEFPQEGVLLTVTRKEAVLTAWDEDACCDGWPERKAVWSVLADGRLSPAIQTIRFSMDVGGASAHERVEMLLGGLDSLKICLPDAHKDWFRGLAFEKAELVGDSSDPEGVSVVVSDSCDVFELGPE